MLAEPEVLSQHPVSSGTSLILPEQPYVGLRSFERRERAVFFGRDRDAEYLRDRVFASRLTVLHGQSGAGKSSLLKTLAVPLLEDQHAVAVYFDAWTSEAPIAALKAELGAIAASLGVADPGAGGPTLSDLVGLVNSVDDRTIVLLLDQFEEFLIARSEQVEPFRRELAALVRIGGPDVRVLLSLRREFLASLEPLREGIPALFQSTYLLPNLDERGLRDAIERPAALFGVTYEPELLDQIIADLAPSAGSTVVDAPSIELPMLQLLCERLWKGRRGGGRVTLARYRELGGLRAILDEYVASVMPKTLAEQRLTATLLQSLAPPSGLKVSFTAEDLASVGAVDLADVRGELTRLTEQRILRARQYRAGTRYELLHDAFIPVVAPWRDRVFARSRVRRRLFTGLAVVGALAALALGLFLERAERAEGLLLERARAAEEQYREQYRLRVTEPFAALRTLRGQTGGSTSAADGRSASSFENQATRAFDGASSYLLYERSGAERLQQLEEQLESNADLLPANYGVDSSGVEFIVLESDRDDWPLTLHYSELRDLDLLYFTHTWQSMAKALSSKWGFPVPTQMRLVVEREFPREHIRVEGPGTQPIELDLPADEDKALIDEAALTAPALEFLRAAGKAWPVLPTASGGPYRIVPSWSLPAWKSPGGLATQGSGILASHIALALEKAPDHLLGDAAAEFLLDRVGKDYPQTVAEVRSARGPRLRDDLVALVRAGNALTSLPVFLDAAANYPDETSAVVASRSTEAATTLAAALPARIHGPWVSGGQIGKQPDEASRSPAESHAMRSAEPWLPSVEPPIRVLLGSALVRTSSLPGTDELAPQLRRVTWSVRSDLYLRFGVAVPGVTFRNEGSLGPDEFRIELLNQTPRNDLARPIAATAAELAPRSSAALSMRAELMREHWISPEYVASALEELEPALRDWLKSVYSITDLKVLLREVVRPDEAELQRWAAAPGTPAPVGPERTIRPLEWLLGSLVFFNLTDGNDLPRLVAHLRELQAARLLPSAGTSEPADAATLQSGVRALALASVSGARSAFEKAIRQNGEAATARFIRSYPDVAGLVTRRRLQRRCELSPKALSTSDRFELHEMLTASNAPSGGAQQAFWRCLVGDRENFTSSNLEAIARVLLDGQTQLGAWSPEDAARLGMQMLEAYDLLVHPASVAEGAARLLESSLERLGSSDERADLFSDVAKRCSKPGPWAWCRALEKRLLEVKPGRRSLLEFSGQLAGRGSVADAELALEYVARAEAMLPSLDASAREWVRLQGLVGRGQALYTLSGNGQDERRAELEQVARELARSTIVRAADIGRTWMGHLLLESGRAEEALSTFEQESPGLMRSQDTFHAVLALANGERLAETARTLLSLSDAAEDASEKGQLLYWAVVGQMLTGTGKWEWTARRFIGMDHEYTRYAAMLLWARKGGEPTAGERGVVDRAWQRADPARWPERLRAEDQEVWREMLIGYYRGNVDGETLFAQLATEASFQASDLRFTGYSRRAMLCEIYFYDALRLQAKGERAGARQRLQQAVDNDYRHYTEYWMARYLLAHDGAWPSP